METKNKDTAFWVFSAVLWLCAIAIWVVAVDRDLPNYGMHGEFDRNDESRRMSEHYFWDDVLDARTDGYLDEDS